MAEDPCDVAVIGGGPAGSVAALTAARLGGQVQLFEASNYDNLRVGETLSPAACQVLRRLKLPWDPLETDATPSFGNRSVWGSPEERSSSFVFGPFGNGCHIDRARFDASLAEMAAHAGARLITGTKVLGGTLRPDCLWELIVEGRDKDRVELRARAVVLATGRHAALARTWGGRIDRLDRLVAIVARAPVVDHAKGYTSVEAVRDGWWYVAALPAGDAIVMLMCDADVCHAERYAWRHVFEKALQATSVTRARLADTGLTSEPCVRPASSHLLRQPDASGRWLACGDAAISLDPLSGSGLLRSLRTGEAAGYAIMQSLVGNADPGRLYLARIEDEYAAYLTNRRKNYLMEKRWPESPFWQRRH